MRKWIVDFETTTAKRKEYDGSTRVWAVGICEVGNPENILILKTMEEFIEWCIKSKTNDTLYFHNLKFDGNFIIQWLLKNEYKFATEPEDKVSKSFTATISDTNLWYEIEIYFDIKGNKVNKVTIRDSYKLIPLSVEDIAESFKLPFKKGNIDYSRHDFLPVGSDLTDEEKDYLIKDVQIVEYALRFFHENGLNKTTIGACALSEYKSMLPKNFFKTYFPSPFYDRDVRTAYKGGFTYLNPKFKDLDLENIIVLDVNSLYPAIMAGTDNEILPCGTPIFFEDEYEYDPAYPLYVQKLECSFKLKKNKIPTIQIKNNPYYNSKGNEYMTTSDGDIVTLIMTSVDLKLFKEQYDLGNVEYLGGWKFCGIKASRVFGEYVEKWSNVKIQSKKDGNWGMYLIAKLMLNNLYGKFGTATTLTNKEPYIGKDGGVHFKKGKTEEKDGIYIAMACFITAYGRAKTIRAAQKITDNYNSGKSDIQFIYADTDSLHCLSPNLKLPIGLNIHSTELGAWDHEATARRGKFIRQKCYMEEHVINEEKYLDAIGNEKTIKELYYKDDNNYYFKKITVAGMPKTCHKYVTFENFKEGSSYEGKLEHKTVNGGIVLEDSIFTIQE